jgi:hypothetical protein
MVGRSAPLLQSNAYRKVSACFTLPADEKAPVSLVVTGNNFAGFQGVFDPVCHSGEHSLPRRTHQLSNRLSETQLPPQRLLRQSLPQPEISRRHLQPHQPMPGAKGERRAKMESLLM